MAIKFNRSQTFATNGTVTASGLHNLVDGLDIYQAIITDQTVMSSVGTGDKLLIADADLTASDAPRAVTVGRLLDDALTAGTYTSAQFSNNLSYGTATGNRTVSTNATITTGTVTTLVSNNATLGTTTGTAATFTNATSTGASITNGTIQTLTSSTANITGGTFGGVLNSSSGTISGDLTISDKIIHSGDTDTAIRFLSNDTVSIETNGTTALTINSSQAASFGRAVSINGVSPNYSALTIKNTSGVETQISANGNSAGEVRTVTDHPLLFFTNNTERLRIDSSGDVGIGTTSPVYKLDVSGSGIRVNNAFAQILLTDTTGGTTTGGFVRYVSNGSSGSYTYQINTAAAGDFTTANNVYTIASAGDVSIGTSTALSKLHVHGNITLSNTTTATSAGTGGLSKPATYAGYLTVSINGTSRKIPYYAT